MRSGMRAWHHRAHGHAADVGARRGAGPDDVVRRAHRGELPQRAGRRCMRQTRRSSARWPISATLADWNAVLDGSASVRFRRRAAGRRSNPGRWLAARSRSDAQHAELPEGHGVQRVGPDREHGAAAVGREQPRLASVRVWPAVQPPPAPRDRVRVLRHRDGGRRSFGKRRRSAQGRPGRRRTRGRASSHCARRHSARGEPVRSSR